ncbi:uncharacterized protein LOC6602145 isoform X1 [Drosophila persimilis]|uniref:uncharacterized protein LOC6602145 isoform X1 n=1 Tax=Drosophila persimilis TaxID=7234 RepID=UPI000F07EF4A|nr:uncharacterized protein LOC6602145 isoform X1 [Drosophila persimilis]
MSFLLNLMGSSLIPAGSTPQAGSLEDGAHRRSTKEMVGLKSCCYFFDLKMGCKLIAFFEALLGLMQIYQCYNLINQPEAVSIGTTTESEFVTRAIEDDSMDPHASHSSSGNHYFTMALETVAVMKSIMLIIGAKTEHKTCLLLWLYLTAVVTFMFVLNTLFINLVVEHLVFEALSVLFPALETYFGFVVLSFYWEVLRKRDGNPSEIEVLFTASEDT